MTEMTAGAKKPTDTTHAESQAEEFNRSSGSDLDGMRLFLREVRRTPLLSSAEEVVLAKRVERGDSAAKERLILANLRLVVSIAKRYHGFGVPYIDLIQEGTFGLHRATERFDHRLGYRFSTYASWWIRQAVSRAVANQSRLIRLPIPVHSQQLRIRRSESALTTKLGRQPSTAELAQEVELSSTEVEAILSATSVAASLDQPSQEGIDSSTVGDLLPDRNYHDPLDRLSATDDRQALHRALERLPQRERQIISLRFGLEGEERTLEQIGDQFQISKERVRQLEVRALSRLATFVL